MRTTCIVLFAGAVLAPLPVGAAAQIDGSFSLSQRTYLAGEPVYLLFTAKNVSNKPLQIRIANPMTFCGGYAFELEGAKDREEPPCGGKSTGGSCASVNAILGPGETRTDQMLLNERYDLRQPGVYPLHVTHRLNYGPSNEGLAALATSKVFEDFQAQLEIVIEPSQPGDLKPKFAQYARDLESNDVQTKLEAAKVIAYLAPPFMEPTILKMLNSPLLESYGIEGLSNFRTAPARLALRNLVKNSPPTNVEGAYQLALLSLGDIGDSSDLPVLMAAARANAPASHSREAAIESAGKAGGAAAIPALVAELKDPSIDTQQDAVRALNLTASRAAVPVLISLLPSREWRVSETAEYGLEVLTHRSGASTKTMNPPPLDAYSQWVRWWKANGQTATIFRSDQCGQIEPLPSP